MRRQHYLHHNQQHKQLIEGHEEVGIQQRGPLVHIQIRPLLDPETHCKSSRAHKVEQRQRWAIHLHFTITNTTVGQQM